MSTEPVEAFLLFFDLETTGLDHEKHEIVEIAARLQPLSDLYRDGASWNFVCWTLRKPYRWDAPALAMHKANGLFEERLSENAIAVEEADKRLSRALRNFKQSIGSKVVIYQAGNTCHFDRAFASRYLPKTVAELHHRVLDVTCVRLFLRAVTGIDWEPPRDLTKPAHRAVADVEQCLAQLRFYKELAESGALSPDVDDRLVPGQA